MGGWAGLVADLARQGTGTATEREWFPASPGGGSAQALRPGTDAPASNAREGDAAPGGRSQRAGRGCRRPYRHAACAGAGAAGRAGRLMGAIASRVASIGIWLSWTLAAESVTLSGSAVAVDHKMALRARFAAVRWVWAGFFAAPRPAPWRRPAKRELQYDLVGLAPRRSNSTWCKRRHTPAACRPLNRRQHVMPDPQPNSWGSISQGMPS